MEDLKVKEFLMVEGSGYGYGDGDGFGSSYGDGFGFGDGYGSGSGDGYGEGDGDGCGFGYGFGDGDGDGEGFGSISGYGFGDGSGDGYGEGDGDGEGFGDGDGDGFGDGSGDGSGSGEGCIAEINGHRVYLVDGVPTIFSSIHGNVAKGYILYPDLTMIPCYVVKGNNLFAHGEDLHKAMAALRDKMFQDMPEEERIAEFIKEHPELNKPYPNRDLFEWHNRLTGSCMAGRTAFLKDRGLSLDGETTVLEFIRLTQNAYGGHTIQNLKKAYGKG